MRTYKWYKNEHGAQQCDIGDDTLIITGKINATGRQAWLRIPNQVCSIKLHDCDPKSISGMYYPKRSLLSLAYKAKIQRLYEAYKRKESKR